MAGETSYRSDFLFASSYAFHEQILETVPSYYKGSPKWDEELETCLQLQWAYGYCANNEHRNNLFVSPSGQLLYFTGAIAVVYDANEHSQSFFTDHTDEITCMAVDHNGEYAATSQPGGTPEILVWDVDTKRSMSAVQGPLEHRVQSVEFSPDGRYLAAVDDRSTIAVFEWGRGTLVASYKWRSPSPTRNLVVRFHGIQKGTVITTGDASLFHLTFDADKRGGAMEAKGGRFGDVVPPQKLTTIGFHPDRGTLIGSKSGDILVWEGNVLQRAVITGHKGTLNALKITPEKLVLTGGDDGRLILWDDTLNYMTDVSIAPLKIRSIAVAKSDLFYVGCEGGDIVQVALKSRKLECKLISEAHGGTGAELWGLCTHPKMKYGFATACDDSSVCVWDAKTHKCIKRVRVEGKARSVDIHCDGSLMAVGFLDGKMELHHLQDDCVVWRHHSATSSCVSVVKFSPDGKKLATAHGNLIDIWIVQKGMVRRGTCHGHLGDVTHLDWCVDSQYIQSNSSATHELLFWDAFRPSKKHQDQMHRVEAAYLMRDVRWHSWSCLYGWCTAGIFPEGRLGLNSISCVSVSNEQSMIVAGDKNKQLKLFRCPAVGRGTKRPPFKSFSGHSDKIANVTFSNTSDFVFSIGGKDNTVLQWVVQDKPPAARIPPPPLRPVAACICSRASPRSLSSPLARPSDSSLSPLGTPLAQLPDQQPKPPMSFGICKCCQPVMRLTKVMPENPAQPFPPVLVPSFVGDADQSTVASPKDPFNLAKGSRDV